MFNDVNIGLQEPRR